MSNSNDVADIRKIQYLRDIEMNLHDTLIMNDLAEDVSAQFGTGITFEMPQMAYMQVGNYAGTLVAKPVVTQSSTMTLNKQPIVTFDYDDVDKLKDSWDAIARADENGVYKIKQQMEGDFFSLYTAARYGNTTPSAVLTTSTALNTVMTAVTTLKHAGVNPNEICVVGDAYLTQILAEQAVSSTFTLSDQSFMRGYTEKKVAGALLYENQNLTATTTLDLATNPTAGDYVKINTIVYTFVTTISDNNATYGTTEGNVLIGVSADASCINLVEAINADATGVAGANVGVKYVAHSADNADFVTGFAAVDGTNLMTLTSKHGYRPLSSSMTDASNDFRAVISNALVMGKNAIKVAYRRGIQNDKRSKEGSLEYRYSNYCLWGQAVSIEGAKKMYRLQFMSQAAES
jgi:hypothetical protein